MRCPFCNAVDGEIKKAKLFNYTALGVVILLVIAIAGIIIFQKTKPLADSVTIDHLVMETSETNTYILAKSMTSIMKPAPLLVSAKAFPLRTGRSLPTGPRGKPAFPFAWENYIL